MAVRQQEIADRLGISRVQVAKALGGHANVSSATRDRVRVAASEMGYTQYSNQSARGLIAKRYSRRAATGIIAVLQPNFGADQSAYGAYQSARALPYFEGFLNGIELEGGTAGLDVFLCTCRNGALPRLVQEHGVDGVVSLGQDHTEGIRPLGLPLVVLDGIREGATCVLPDDSSGIGQVVHHLAELGHQRIAYLGPRAGGSDPERELRLGTSVLARRLNAFKEATKQNGLDRDPGLIEATLESSQIPAGAAGASRLLARDRSFTAVVCYNDTVAMGAVRQLISEGLRVPEDISVAGFDNISEAYAFLPRLTSVASPRHEMGRRAVRLLQDDIAEPDLESRREEFPVDLVVRETTAAPRANGELNRTNRHKEPVR